MEQVQVVTDSSNFKPVENSQTVTQVLHPDIHENMPIEKLAEGGANQADQGESPEQFYKELFDMKFHGITEKNRQDYITLCNKLYNAQPHNFDTKLYAVRFLAAIGETDVLQKTKKMLRELRNPFRNKNLSATTKQHYRSLLYQSRGDVLLHTKQYPKAAQEYHRALVIHDMSGEERYDEALHKAYERARFMSRHPEQLAIYDKAIEDAVHSDQYLDASNITKDMAAEGLVTEALQRQEAIRERIEHNSSDTIRTQSLYESWCDTGALYKQMGNYNEAIHAYEQALRYSPNNTFLLNELAQAYYRTGQKDKAVEFYSQWLRKQQLENIEQFTSKQISDLLGKKMQMINRRTEPEDETVLDK